MDKRNAVIGLLSLLVLAPVLPPALPARAEPVTLSIIHTNDFHARLDPVTIAGNRCRPVDATEHKCFGGIARIATEIEKLRVSQPHPLVVDAGDRFQGSLYYNYYKSAAIKPFFELLGYQAMTLGNHEFDDGPAELARFLTGLTVPVISANVDASAEPALAGKFGATLILPGGDQRIGLIGLTTPSTATNSKAGPTVHFTDPVEAARAGVAKLHAEGVKRIIVLSHLGFTEDQKLAAAVDGLSVIVGGHSHTLIGGSNPRSVAQSPVVVNAASGRPTLIVQSYFAGIFLGFLQVTLDDDGVPTAWQGEPILLADTIAEDPTAKAFVEALAKPLAEQNGKIIGQAAVDLIGDATHCRFGECNLGDLITDAMIADTAGQQVQIAVTNGGGIRTGIPVGPVTLGQVLEVLPFANTISTFKLSGADLRAALENGVSRAENPGGDGTGRFPQVSGLRFTWDAAAPAGQRIVSIETREPDGSYAPLDPARLYMVASMDFLRNGGDGYTVFRDKAIEAYDGGSLLSEATANFITAKSPLKQAVEGRITRK